MKRIKNKEKTHRKKKQFCIHGHDTFVVGRTNGRCNQCAKEYGKKYRNSHKKENAKYRRKHKKRIEKQQKKWRNKNKKVLKKKSQIRYAKNKKVVLAKVKKWQNRHRRKYRASRAKYYFKHKRLLERKHKKYYEEHCKEISLAQKKRRKHRRHSLNKWRKRHPESVSASNIKNQTKRRLRIVAWTDWDNINNFERNKPKKMTTDHVIPLQSKLVCGLHVSWNLQYLTKSENSRKKNMCNLLEASVWWGKILQRAGLK